MILTTHAVTTKGTEMRKPSRKVAIIASSVLALALLCAGGVAVAATLTPEPKTTALSRDAGHFTPDLPQDAPAVETPAATPDTPVDQTTPVTDDAPAPAPAPDNGTRSETPPRTDAPAPSQPAPKPPAPPAPEPPAPPAPQPQPPAPTPVSVQTNGFYSPGCDYVTNPVYVHDPGAGGTSVVTLNYPWTYSISGTTVSVFACADW